MAINISIASDVTDVIRGTKKIGDALEDVADEIDKLDKADVDKLEGSLDDAADGAQRLEKRMSDAFRGAADAADTSGRQIGDSTRAGLDKAGEGLEEFKGEANSTAKESAASFDGSAESIADAFQEIAANAFAGFGPAGAAAGLALAAGIGIAIQKATELAEANTKAAEEAGELGREIYETGGKLDDAAIAEKIRDIAFALAEEDNPWTIWADEAATGIGEVKDAVEGVKDVDAGDVFKGLAGDVEASQEAYDQLTRSIERDRDAMLSMTDTLGDGTMALSTEGRQLEDSIAAREKLKEKLEESTGASERSREEVEFFTEAMGTSAEAIEARAEAQEEAAEREQEAIEATTQALRDQADAQNAIGQANMGATEAAIAYKDTLAQMTEDIRNNGQATDIMTEAGEANALSLIDLANAALGHRDALIAQGDGVTTVTTQVQASRDAFIAAAEAAGYDAAAAAALADSYGLIPGNVETQVAAYGTEEAKAAVESIPEAKDTTVTVEEQGAAEAQGTIEAVQGVERTVTVKEEGADAVQTRINRITGRDIPINLYVANEGAIQATLDRLTAPRSVFVTVNERPGVQV